MDSLLEPRRPFTTVRASCLRTLIPRAVPISLHCSAPDGFIPRPTHILRRTRLGPRYRVARISDGLRTLRTLPVGRWMRWGQQKTPPGHRLREERAVTGRDDAKKLTAVAVQLGRQLKRFGLLDAAAWCGLHPRPASLSLFWV